jgi:hypothetical protein
LLATPLVVILMAEPSVRETVEQVERVTEEPQDREAATFTQVVVRLSIPKTSQ